MLTERDRRDICAARYSSTKAELAARYGVGQDEIAYVWAWGRLNGLIINPSTTPSGPRQKLPHERRKAYQRSIDRINEMLEELRAHRVKPSRLRFRLKLWDTNADAATQES